MADIIEKIGKYFATQEANVRASYTHAAASASPLSVSAAHAKNAVPQPPPRGETDAGKPRRASRPATNNATEASPSLVRTRLPLSKQCEGTAGESKMRVKSRAVTSEDASSLFGGMDTRVAAMGNRASVSSWHECSDGEASVSSLSTISASTSEAGCKGMKSAKKKKKRKKSASKQPVNDDIEQAQRHTAQQRAAAEGFARAQERARRIQLEKAAQDKQQQREREANAARLAEEMRKIEAIRQRGKQFAMRLRPQSAPPSSLTPRQQQQRQGENTYEEDCDEAAAAIAQAAPNLKATFLDAEEQELYEQMMAEMTLNQAIHEKHTLEQDEWSRLQAQIKKVGDRNAIRQARVDSLTKRKDELQRELSENQGEAAALRRERQQLEDKSKRERLLKQREAEREIHARLRREESQRLVDDERAHSDQAARARAKAKMRVQSRAALLKRVLHGCDIPSSSRTSQNQTEDDTPQVRIQVPVEFGEVPELAEFEEEGLSGECFVPQATPTAVEPSFSWQVPAMTEARIHSILRDAFDALSDSD